MQINLIKMVCFIKEIIFLVLVKCCFHVQKHLDAERAVGKGMNI